MDHLLIAVVLGLIEGITEFIPVSSTGHLLLAEHFLKAGDPGHAQFFGSEFFNASIQAGAVLAALPLFKDRLATLKRWSDPAARGYFIKLLAAFAITCAGALLMKKLGLELPETVWPVATALGVGGMLFLIAERWIRGRTMTADVTWTVAVAVGLAQLAAVAFPGTSRSGATILIALLLGLARVQATEFSFLLGVPTLCAAAAKTAYDAFKAGDTIYWSPLIIAGIVAAVSSFAAVKWLLGYVRSHTFEGFGWYRIGLAVLVVLLVGTGGR